LAKKGRSDKKTKSKPAKKRTSFIVSAVVILCVIGLVFLVLNPGVVEATATAELVDISGVVEVKQGETWTTAESNMELYESDSVRTGENSSASIVIFKGSIIRLDSNTEVTLTEIIQQEEGNSVTIDQEFGRTWSTVQGISGIDDYEVQTPTAVASVRGTSFDVNVSENGTTIIGVIRGIVNVSTTINGTVYTVELNENYSVTVDFDEMGDPQDFDQDDWIANNLLKDEGFVEDIKSVLRERIEPYLDEIADLLGEPIPEEHIDVLIGEFIQGRSLPPETPDHILEIFDLS